LREGRVDDGDRQLHVGIVGLKIATLEILAPRWQKSLGNLLEVRIGPVAIELVGAPSTSIGPLPEKTI